MVHVDVDYCGQCGHEIKFHELRQVVCARVPEAKVAGFAGRQGSFEVEVNRTLVYSKLATLAFPDMSQVAEVVEEVAMGGPVRPVTSQQPITCSVM